MFTVHSLDDLKKTTIFCPLASVIFPELDSPLHFLGFKGADRPAIMTLPGLVQCSVTLCNAVQCSAVHCSVVHRVVHCSALPFSVIQCISV